MTNATPYSARVRNVELLERGKAQTTQLAVYRDGAQITPTSATYTLIKPNSNKVVEDGTCTILGDGTLQYVHTPAQLANSLELGEGYMQEFSVTISSTVHVFRRMCAVVLRRLYPVISDADLEEVYSDIANLRSSTMTSYQSYIDSAWYTILRRIRNMGAGFEYLVTTPESFAEAHRHLSLYLIFRDFHSSLGQSEGRYLELAQEHYKLYQDEFGIINFVYDENHENKPEDANKRTRMQPSIYLTRPGEYKYRRRRYGF
jgi:hypothetical protein